MSFSNWTHIHIKLQKPIKEGGECNLEQKCSIDWRTPHFLKDLMQIQKWKQRKKELKYNP
jgi:hypothetical protein